MSDDKLPIFLSAGDPSGDIAGVHLINVLKSRDTNIKLYGLGGPRMKAAGQKQIVEGPKLAVLGFWEVAKKYLFFRRLMSDTVAAIKNTKPRAIILIDYPGFNLRLAERIKHLRIPIIYYVSPQIWAWGRGRLEQIKRLVDLMLLILPFEKQLYDRAGVKNCFVGHYLLDDIDPKLIGAPYNINSDLIALLPGSRPQEVQRMLPTLLGTAKILLRRGKYRFAIGGIGSNIDYNYHLKKCNLPVELQFGKTRELIAASRLVLTSSGTATLEIGIIGRPMVIIYKTGFLTYTIARRLVKLDKIGLINIAADKIIVPELIQHQATPEKIADAATRFLDDNDYSLKTVGELLRAADLLGSAGVSERAVDAIWELIH